VGFEVFLEFQRFVFIRKGAIPDYTQGLNFAVCVDLPALWSVSRRFKSEVAPMYSCSGKLMLRMM
jgi:hypothetical protein